MKPLFNCPTIENYCATHGITLESKDQCIRVALSLILRQDDVLEKVLTLTCYGHSDKVKQASKRVAQCEEAEAWRHINFSYADSHMVLNATVENWSACFIEDTLTAMASEACKLCQPAKEITLLRHRYEAENPEYAKAWRACNPLFADEFEKGGNAFLVKMTFQDESTAVASKIGTDKPLLMLYQDMNLQCKKGIYGGKPYAGETTEYLICINDDLPMLQNMNSPLLDDPTFRLFVCRWSRGRSPIQCLNPLTEDEWLVLVSGRERAYDNKFLRVWRHHADVIAKYFLLRLPELTPSKADAVIGKMHPSRTVRSEIRKAFMLLRAMYPDCLSGLAKPPTDNDVAEVQKGLVEQFLRLGIFKEQVRKALA